MNKILWPAGTLLGPVPPAMVSCGTIENPNVLTVAWTGIINSDPAMTYVSIRPSRYSHGLIEQSKEFVINLPTLKLAEICDSVGIKSGAKIDKFKEYELTALPCEGISAPQIAESPVSLVCKVVDVRHFRTHDMFLAEIIGVYVDDAYLDENGKLCLEKAGLLAFLHGAYYTLGREVGKMGFSVDKKAIKKKLSLKAKQTALQDSLSEKATGKNADNSADDLPGRPGAAKSRVKKDKFMINRFTKKTGTKPHKKIFDKNGKKDFIRQAEKDFAGELERNSVNKSKRDFTKHFERNFEDKPSDGFKGKRENFEKRPARRFKDRPKQNFEEKPHGSFGNGPGKNFFDKSRKSGNDKPRKHFNNKPNGRFVGKTFSKK